MTKSSCLIDKFRCNIRKNVNQSFLKFTTTQSPSADLNKLRHQQPTTFCMVLVPIPPQSSSDHETKGGSLTTGPITKPRADHKQKRKIDWEMKTKTQAQIFPISWISIKTMEGGGGRWKKKTARWHLCPAQITNQSQRWNFHQRFASIHRAKWLQIANLTYPKDRGSQEPTHFREGKHLTVRKTARGEGSAVLTCWWWTPWPPPPHGPSSSARTAAAALPRRHATRGTPSAPWRSLDGHRLGKDLDAEDGILGARGWPLPCACCAALALQQGVPLDVEVGY